MSARPETIALLDRLYGTDRQIGDQINRLDQIECDYRSIVEHLAFLARNFLDAEDGEQSQEAASELASGLKWAEAEAAAESSNLLDVASALRSLVGAP